MSRARLLRLLRYAAGLSIDQAATEIEAPQSRLRALERGDARLDYLEGLLMAKAYLLCPNCFARHCRAAASREGVAEIPAQTGQQTES